MSVNLPATASDAVNQHRLACGTVITTRTRVDLAGPIGPCTGTAIRIQANGATLDCHLNPIVGSGTGSISNSTDSIGIYLDGVTGVTIQNCVVRGFVEGILLGNSSGNNLTSSVARASLCGFCLYNSSRNTLMENTADSSPIGFLLADSDTNDLRGNSGWNSTVDGFAILNSDGNVLMNNFDLISLIGYLVILSAGNTLQGNSAYGDQIGFSVIFSNTNQLNYNIAGDNHLGGMILLNSTLNTLLGNIASDNGENLVSPNMTSFSSGGAGILLLASNSNTLRGNVADSNYCLGVGLIGSSLNTIDENTETMNGIGAHWCSPGSESPAHGRTGLYFDTTSGGNRVQKNWADTNFGWGIQDGNLGPSNIYLGNVCVDNSEGGSSPPSLC